MMHAVWQHSLQIPDEPLAEVLCEASDERVAYFLGIHGRIVCICELYEGLAYTDVSIRLSIARIGVLQTVVQCL